MLGSKAVFNLHHVLRFQGRSLEKENCVRVRVSLEMILLVLLRDFVDDISGLY
jgi:hypothetical protein